VYRLRAEKFGPWVRPEHVVVELGVGAGWNLARMLCARRIGCDAAEFLAPEVAALGIEFFANTRDLGDATADVVIAHHVLEHLIEPAAALRDLGRVLRPDGRLIVHVPWEIERRYAHYRPDEPNHHVHSWNAQSLGNWVTALGWRIESIRVRRHGYDRFAANAAARLRAGETGFRLVRAAMLALRPVREVELVARHGALG
jgi:SAM-dependent methyltransferase